MPTFSDTIPYDIFDKKDHSITLTVKFGFNQLATTMVKLDTEDKGSFDDGFTIDLGSNMSLNNKQLMLFSTISDINPSSDQVSMEVTIEGGKETVTKMVLDSTVPTNGVISGIVSILFF